MKKEFVIQKHSSGSEQHWDLMLQVADSLWTWRICVPPEDIKEQEVIAEKIADHPLKFLTYQGPVKNNTGQVSIADQGGYEIIDSDKTKMIMQMDGEILKGRFILEQIDKARWQLKRIAG